MQWHFVAASLQAVGMVVGTEVLGTEDLRREDLRREDLRREVLGIEPQASVTEGPIAAGFRYCNALQCELNCIDCE
jgi:hypothetical protein